MKYSPHRSLCLLAALCSYPVFISFSQPASSDRDWNVLNLFRYQRSLHDCIRVQDGYKLLYQAHFGVEHILVDSLVARQFLLQELVSLEGSTSNEPLIERISTDNRMVRINLRPFKDLNLEPDLLVKAMFVSAAGTTADTLEFYREWNEFSSLVAYGLLEIPPDDLQAWNERINSGEFLAKHHSAQYSRANKPAYRVVLREAWESIVLGK